MAVSGGVGAPAGGYRARARAALGPPHPGSASPPAGPWEGAVEGGGGPTRHWLHKLPLLTSGG
jgi:hypothetical protein